MATVDLGKISFVNKGTYDASTTYEERDVVQFTDGALSSYVYINATPASGQTPSTGGTVNSSHWSLFAGGVSLAVGNNKIITTDGSGNVSSLAIGSTDTFLKVTGSNTLGFATVDSGKIKKVHWWWDNTQASIPQCTGNSNTGLTIASTNFTAACDNPFFSLTTNFFIGIQSGGNDRGDVYTYAYIEKAGSVKYRFGFYKNSGLRSNATFGAAAGNYYLDESDAGIASDTNDWGGYRHTNANVWGNNTSAGTIASNQPAQTTGISSGDTLTFVMRIGGSGHTYYNRTQNHTNSISRSFYELKQWSSM